MSDPLDHMVDTQIRKRGVKDPRVLAAMRQVPRDHFVPREFREFAFSDGPLPLSSGQTISQPYMVAVMTEMLQIQPGDRILEIGTGSGYQTAVLAELAEAIYSVEILPGLLEKAQSTLKGLGYDNIHFKQADGWYGWPEAGPFDAALVAAAPEDLPTPLFDQLKPGGRLVVPVGPTGAVQNLLLIKKDINGDLHTRDLMSVRFVPLTGNH